MSLLTLGTVYLKLGYTSGSNNQPVGLGYEREKSSVVVSGELHLSEVVKEEVDLS